MTESEEHAVLLNEIRYAQRITQRTARLYRHLATVLTFLAILGGSGVFTTASTVFPQWVVLAGGLLLAVSGAVALSVRPLEKAILNEQDLKRYTQLATKAHGMDLATLRTELEKARESDAAEVELLRDVAYNDVVLEAGHPELKTALTFPQRVVAALA